MDHHRGSPHKYTKYVRIAISRDAPGQRFLKFVYPVPVPYISGIRPNMQLVYTRGGNLQLMDKKANMGTNNNWLKSVKMDCTGTYLLYLINMLQWANK